jgi:hypothetical protein
MAIAKMLNALEDWRDILTNPIDYTKLQGNSLPCSCKAIQVNKRNLAMLV